MYSRPKQRDAGGGSGGGYSFIEENIYKNSDHFLNEILQPKYMELLIMIFTKIISHLKSNCDQLEKKDINKLTVEIEDLNEELKQTATRNHVVRPKNTP